MLHEPIIWKFRELSSFLKKLKHVGHKGDPQRAASMKKNTPTYSLGKSIERDLKGWMGHLTRFNFGWPVGISYTQLTPPFATGVKKIIFYFKQKKY